MKKVLNFLIGRHSIIILVTILVVLDLLLIANLIAPQILQFLIDKHIFEIVTLTSFVEVILLLASNLWQPTLLVIGSEEEAQEKIRSLLKEDTGIKSIKVLSAGLRSRAGFLRALLEIPRKLNLEIVACFGKESPNPDKLDRDTLGPTHFEVITHRLDQDEKSRLKIYGSLNTPSFRCILLSDSRGPRYAFIGWYTYYGKNTKITGRRNVQIFVDRTTEIGAALLHFTEEKYKIYASEQEANILWPQSEVTKYI
jgi:hypothetical protein